MGTSGVLWTVVGCLSPAPPNINLALGPSSHTAMGGPKGASKQIHLEIEKYPQHWWFCLGCPSRVWNRPMKGALRSGLGRLCNKGLDTGAPVSTCTQATASNTSARRGSVFAAYGRGPASQCPLPAWKLVSSRELLDLSWPQTPMTDTE